MGRPRNGVRGALILSIAMAVALLATLPAVRAAEVFAGNAALNSLFDKLGREPHPQLGAGNWDLLDYPQPPGGDLALEDVQSPGAPVDLMALRNGRVLVLVEIDTTTRYARWKADKSEPPALAAYRRAFDEYTARGVEFAAVWSNNGAVQRGDRDAFLSAARAYAGAQRLPGRLFLDAPAPSGKRQSVFYTFVGARVPGHPPAELTCVVDASGRIVFRSYEKDLGFSYHTVRHILDRLLDGEYDRAVRREFHPGKSRDLPRAEPRSGGLAYLEDFESYGDSHGFKLEPRWGFRYETQSRLDLRSAIAPGAGRGGSKAALVHGVTSINVVGYGLEHRFPAPLTDGRLRFFVRRRPDENMKEPLLADVKEITNPMSRFQRAPRALGVRFTQPGTREPAGFLMAAGDWEKETFVGDFRIDRAGPVAFSREGWHEVVVECSPGRKAAVSVDGVPIAELLSEAIDGVGFRLFDSRRQFYVDEVEVFYRGGAAAIREQHRAARSGAVEAVAPFTAAEQAELLRKYTAIPLGPDRATLGPKAIARVDVVASGPRNESLFFDHPLPVDDLILDDLRTPGALVNVTEKYRGRIIWVTKAHKGDHFGEEHYRKRTGNRNYTVFNRVAKLAREYRDKGIVVIGVCAPESGHRDCSTSFGDRIGTVFEAQWITQALMAEANLKPDAVIYGFYPELYHELVAERLPNHLRIWNRSFGGRIIEGQFAEFGPDAILDREGRIVFRGEGPDGQGYFLQRIVLDRLLDADFDAACRQDFRNPGLALHRPPTLPQALKTPEGLAYRDGFETYADSYEFRLQPRWGFAYEDFCQQSLEFGGTIESGAGREGSKALTCTGMAQADVLHPNRRWSWATHKLPVPLRDGHVRLFIRRGPKVNWFGTPPVCRVFISAFDDKGVSLGGVTTTSEWKNERFLIARPLDAFVDDLKRKDLLGRSVQGLPFELAPHWKDIGRPGGAESAGGGLAMAEDAWQEVRLVCAPGQPVRVQIDGKDIGELGTHSLSAIEIRGETYSSTFVDDFEVFYRGDADTIAAEHARAIDDDFRERQARWIAEAAE